jgi:hypothetical protein
VLKHLSSIPFCRTHRRAPRVERTEAGGTNA